MNGNENGVEDVSIKIAKKLFLVIQTVLSF